MKLGFIGTGNIVSDVVTGISKSKINYKQIIISPRNKKKALYIPPYNWVTIFFKNDMDSILTLCDFKYDKKEYISEYQNFKKLIYK